MSHTMTLPRLYCPNLGRMPPELPVDELHHARNVLRARPGDQVVLFDGAGLESVATIGAVHRSGIELESGEVVVRPFELACRLTLFSALPRQHRQGFLVEKCTELGAAALVPIATARSVVRPSASLCEKLHRRAVEAAKQSGRCFVPTIEGPQRFTDSLPRAVEFTRPLIANPTADGRPLLDVLRDVPYGGHVACWIGPEGGWTDDELRAAEAAGIASIRLAPTILRIETAAMTVCAAAALHSAGRAV